jgi:hypothetical protein
MFKVFGREPIVWLTGAQSVLAVIVSVPALGVSAETAAWVITAASAVLGALEAWSVRPFTVAAMTAAVRTTAAALILFGLPISPELGGALVAVGTFVLGLLTAGSVTPVADPDPAFTRGRPVTMVGRHG